MALVVSSSLAPVSVPNVVGDTQAAATTAITGAGLTVGTVTTQSSVTVASGKVISENRTACNQCRKGIGGGAGAFPAVLPALLRWLYAHRSGRRCYRAGAQWNGLRSRSRPTGLFTLPMGVRTGGKAYTLTVGTPTTTAAQTCNVQNGSGTVTTANVTNVVVYGTYTVTVATLNKTYTTVVANFDRSPGQLQFQPFSMAQSLQLTAAPLPRITTTATAPSITPKRLPRRRGIQDTYAVATTNGIANDDLLLGRERRYRGSERRCRHRHQSGRWASCRASTSVCCPMPARQPRPSMAITRSSNLTGNYSATAGTNGYASPVSAYVATIAVANGGRDRHVCPE